MVGQDGVEAPGEGGGASADETPSTLRPQTASVLAALAGRGVDLPGVSRPKSVADADGGPDTPRYTVLDQVARGGMGVVMRVRDEDLRRDLAMKVLDRAGREPDSLASDPRDIGRFLEEAQVTGQLDHPGVPPIHELGLDRDGRLFFTMKLVRGGTFLDVINDVRAEREGWTTMRALSSLMKVCEALAYAHHKGVVHRDIKPANIMVGRFGETYVMDWGLAKVLETSGNGQPSYDSMVSRSIVHTDRRAAVDDDASTHATLFGDVVGTPAYMAPEQARGDIEAIGPHTDIYAVGALLYHLLCGQAPYLEPGVRVSPHSVLRWVIDGPPKPLADLAPDAPPELIAVIDKAMAREPSLRYTSMLDLSGDLQAFIEDRVVRAYQSGAWAEARKWMVRNKPLAAAAGLLLVVTLGALGAVSWVQSSGRAAVEERNLLLGQSNTALEGANAQLGTANAALEDKNVQLAETNAALDRERAEAEQARAAAEDARAQALANAELAQANAERAALSAEEAEANAEQAAANAREAEANERRALVESYAANMTAAVAALEVGAGAAARRHLAACAEDLRGWDWRHLSLRADPSLYVWSGADSLLQDVVHSPDGTMLATASGPYGNFGAPVRETRLLDSGTGETLLALPSEFTVDQVAFSPNGRYLAHATGQDVRLRDLERDRPHTSRHWIGNDCHELQFLDDERLMVLSLDEGNDLSRLDVWNIDTDQVEFSVDSSPAMTAAAPTPDGTQLVIGRSDHSVELLSIPDGDPVWQRPALEDPAERSVRLNNLPGVTGVAFDALGERLVVTGRDGVVHLLDARDGRELASHEIEGASPGSPCFHPDGPWVIVGDSSGSVRFLDADTLVQIERLSGHDQVVMAVSISADGDRLVSAGMLGDLRVWDGRPGAASLVIASRAATGDVGVDASHRTIAWSPDGRLVAWTASPQSTLVTDALTGEVLYRLAEVNSATATLAFTPDGQRVLVQSEVGGVQAFDVTDGRLLSAMPSGRYADWASFDPSGSVLAMIESRTDLLVDLRVAQTGQWAARLSGHQEPVTGGQFTADSQRYVSCSLDGTLRVWDLRTRNEVQVIDGGDDFLTVELFDGDRRAVTTTLDPTQSGLSVWDLEAGELIARHPARGLTLRGSLHPGGKLWAGSRTSGSVGIWDLERGEMFSLPAGEYPITHTSFDPTGTRLAAVDRGGHLFLWDTVHPRDRRAVRGDAAHLARRVGEARALVDGLIEEHLLMRRVIEVLEADRTLDADLREAAVRDMRVRGDDGPWVIAELWERMLPADVPDDQLASAPAVRAAAEALLPIAREAKANWYEYGDAWEPLLWALYVLGRTDEAALLIPDWIDCGYSHNPSGPQAGQAIEALVTVELGDEPLAQAQLDAAWREYERAQREAPGDVVELAVNARLLALAEARLGTETDAGAP